MKKKLLALPLLGLSILTLASCQFLDGLKSSSTINSSETEVSTSNTTPNSTVASSSSSETGTNTSSSSSTNPTTSNTTISTSTSTSTTSSTTTGTTSNTTPTTGTTTSTSTSTSISTSTRTSTSTTTSTPTSTRTSTSTSTSTSTKTSTNTSTSTSTSSSSSSSSSGENHGVTITQVTGYGEGAFAKFDAVSGKTYNAYYKKTSDSSYTKIDSELVRINGDSGRVDVLGLTPGEYTLKIERSDYTSTYSITNSFTVYEQDRSGYAHFNYSDGVGAYNDDGTLKNNAVVVYVSEANKNTVTAKIGNNTYTGLTNILQHCTKTAYPVNIRIIGTIGAPTWNPLTVSNYYDSSTKKGVNPETAVMGANGQYLSLKSYSESEIISGGFNDLDTSVYSKLDGLTNKINYDSSKLEFDSYYNMMDISGAQNVTVEGVGTDATIFQWGFTWKSSNSIEIKNLTFDDYTEDACSFEGSGSDSSLTTLSSFANTNYWIHNNTFNRGVNYWDVCSEQDKHDGDGATDFKRVAYVTVAYNEYYNNHKTGLVGGGDSHMTAALTFHHNYYNQCQARLPFARQANMHMYNNYYYKSSGNNMQIYAGAYAFIENCYFENIQSNTFLLDQRSSSYGVPAIKSLNNIYDNCKNYSGSTIVTSRTTTVTNGNVFNPTFDTSTTDFYYDSTNKKSIVSVMNDADDIPTIIPRVAGAGKFGGYIDDSNSSSSGSTDPVTPTTYTTVLNDTFTVAKSATKTDSIPTNSGLYYHISDSEANASSDADSANYVTVANNKLNVHDESTTTTTWAYYMFDTTYTSGKVKYTVTFTPTKQAGSWSPITFMGSSTNLALRSNSSKIWGYSSDNSNVTTIGSDAYSINTSYTITLTIDFDENIVKMSLDDTEVTVTGISSYEVLGIKFMTAKGDDARSFTVSNIKIETSN